MQIERAKLLSLLKTLVIGTSAKNVIEQSHSFVFQAGQVITFNDELACIAASPLDIEGAVIAQPLLDVLEKFPDETVDITLDDAELLVRAKRRRAGITLQQEIALPIEFLETPTGNWKPLPAGFFTSLLDVAECVSKDETHFDVSCVHITAKWVEATDNYQIARYEVKTGIKEPCLIRGSSVKKLRGLTITHYGATDAWFHFRTQDDIVISIRRYQGDFRDLSPYLQEDGTPLHPLHLPAGIENAIENSRVFSAHREDGDVTLVSLKDNVIVIEGRSDVGWYQEQNKINYQGEKVRFSIASNLLLRFTKRHSQCLLAPGRLIVRDQNLLWAGCVGEV